MWKDILYYDAYLGHLINRTGSKSQDIFWTFITEPTSWIPFFIILIYLNFKWFGRKNGIRIFTCVLLAFTCTGLMTYITKNIVQRVRPIYHETFANLFRLTADADGYSFFSGHTSNSVTISTLLFLIFRHKTNHAYFVFCWPFLFAYSRLYLGVHYPLDVLCGAMVGITVAFIAYSLLKKYHCTCDKEDFQIS